MFNEARTAATKQLNIDETFCGISCCAYEMQKPLRNNEHEVRKEVACMEVCFLSACVGLILINLQHCMESEPKRKLLVALSFFAIYIVWGTTYLAALWGLDSFEPFVLSALRYLMAGFLLLTWCIISRYRLPDTKSMLVCAGAGIVMLVGGSGLVVVAEKYISSGHAAVVIATEPLWFLLLDRKRWNEYFSNKSVITGLVIGFAGIAAFAYFSPQQSGTSSQIITGTLLTLAGSVMWVVGALFYERSAEVKKHPHVLMTTVQLFGAGLFSSMIALILGEWEGFSFHAVSANAWTGLLFLVFMGSIIAYMAFMWLMKVQPPAIVATHTYVNPIVAIFIGWLLANEQITWMQFVALLIVLAGVLLTRVKSNQGIAA